MVNFLKTENIKILHWSGSDVRPASIPRKFSYILYKKFVVIF